MFRYQVYRLLGYLLMAALGGAMTVHAVLIALGIVSIDVPVFIGRVIIPILYMIPAGAWLLSGVCDICRGKWRKSTETERELRWRPPRGSEEWDVVIFFAAMVLAGAGLVVVGFRGGFLFVPPIVFWAAGGVLILGGGLALLFDEWREEMIHMRRNSSRVPPQEPIIGNCISFADFPVYDGEYDDDYGPPGWGCGERTAGG